MTDSVGFGNLLPVSTGSIGNQSVQTVNARNLHSFLEVQTAFKDWIVRRISEYGFQEGRDFCSFLSESQGGRPAKEYAISLDMAKELSMVERNERGRRARLYFIDCERRARASVQAVDPMQALNDPSTMRGLLLTYSEKVLTLQAEVKAMAPDVEAYRRIANTDGLLCLTEAAKLLGQQPKAFNRWLTANRYIYRRPGGSLLAYQDRIQSGILEHKLALYRKPDGSDGSRDQVMVTRRGLTHFAKKLGVVLPDDLFGHSIAAE